MISRKNRILGILVIITVLSGPVFYQPSTVSQNTPKPGISFYSPFASTVPYKIATGLKSIEKGDVSTYYQANIAGWQSAGYNAALWAFCSDCATTTPTFPLPGDGSFDFSFPPGSPPSLDVFAQDGRPFWNKNPAVLPSGWILNVSTTTTSDGGGAFHVKTNVTSSTYAHAGITQDLAAHFWYAPLVSNILFTGQLLPKQLTDSTGGADDSLIVFEFDMSYWNQATTPTRMYFVYHNNPAAKLDNAFPANDTNTLVFDLTASRPLQLAKFNPLNWNVTKFAIDGFGDRWRGLDNRILSLTVQSWSRNGATSEFYLDQLSLKSQLGRDASHAIQESLLSHWNTSATFPMYSGLADMSQGLNRPMWFDTNNYPIGSGSSQQDILNIASAGGYPFIAAPFDFRTPYQGVFGLPVFSETSGWNGTGKWVPNGAGLWDTYLNAGVMAMGFVNQHAYTRDSIKQFVTQAPATFVYSDSLAATSIIEAMAQGRSFGEYTSVKPSMNLYFAAENDLVGMGRFPIYVDSSTQTVSVHIKLDNVPIYTNPLTVRIIEDGVIIQNLTLPGPVTSFDRVVSNLPLIHGASGSGTDYFRYEVFSKSNPILAFSNPIFFARSPGLPVGVWMAETPGLAYGTSNSFISNIGQTSTGFTFNVNAPAGMTITTKVYSPMTPRRVNGALPNYDPVTKLLTITTTGIQQVSVSYAPDFDVTVNPGSISIQAGSTGTATVSTQSLGYVGSVTLSATVSPALYQSPTVTIDKSNFILTAGGNVASQLIVATSYHTPLQSYSIKITATNSTTTHLAYLNLILTQPPPPDFSMAANPDSVTILSTDYGNSTITLGSIYGFTGDVQLSTTISDTRLACALDQNPVTLTDVIQSASTHLSCNGPEGNYNVTVTGQSGSLSHNVLVKYKVQIFTVSADPATITVLSGETGTSTIAVKAKNGFSDMINLQATVSPQSGLACSVSTTKVQAAGVSTLTCRGSVGTYTVQVTGAGGQVSESTTVIVTVQDFTIQSDPASVTTKTDSNGTSTIAVRPLNGLSDNITLSITGISPGGLSCTLTETTITAASGDTILTCNGSAGAHTVTVTGTLRASSHTTNVNYNIASNVVTRPSNVLSYWPFIIVAAIGTVVAGIVLTLKKKT